MKLFMLASAALAAAAEAAAGWQIIASDIGGSPLGVSFFEDGLTGITATSQIVPAGYEAKRSTDGGKTWATVPDQDLFIFGLYNSAVFNNSAVISGMEFIQYSEDRGTYFNASPAGPAGGEIVRKLLAPSGEPAGFAIMGETESGDTNGFVYSWDGGYTWALNNIMWTDPEIISIDGSFINGSWVAVGNTYITSDARAAKRPSPRTRKLRWETSADGSAPRLVKTPADVLRAAEYSTEVVTSADGGATFKTVYMNKTVAALGVACLDAQHCCFVGEDASYSYAFCTQDGWQTVSRTLADLYQGSAIVEVAAAPGTCPNGGDAYVAVGGYVTDAGQSPSFWRSCDKGLTWAKDATINWQVGNLLATDVDCQPALSPAQCWVTLWDQSGGGGIDPNGYVAKYFSS